MTETHLRSVVKAVSYRFVGTLWTMVISYVITQQVSFAFYIGIAEFISKIFIFYFHERVWHFIPFGRKERASLEAKKLQSSSSIV